jgi:hypothetical protein
MIQTQTKIKTSEVQNVPIKNSVTNKSVTITKPKTKVSFQEPKDSKIPKDTEVEVKEDPVIKEVNDVKETKPIVFDSKTLNMSLHKCNQSGYRTKTSPELIIAGEECGTIKATEEVEEQVTGLDNEGLNDLKITYRSGFQVKAVNPTPNEELLLMGVRDNTLPIKNGGIFGSSNGANGHNGWMRNGLYKVDYLNIDGVGKLPK